MKVELLSHTPDALELLLFTKNTRLQGEQSVEDIKNWSEEKKQEHFNYMLDTIQSSFEFVDYTFKISGVPRSFTHQLVRTRTGSYAQESQRTVDVRDHGFEAPSPLRQRVTEIVEDYAQAIDDGIPVQEAREILPTGMHTSIIAKFDLRTLHNMALVRLCTRTAGMYQDVFREIKKLVVAEHPWAEDFIQVHCGWYGTCAFPRYEECPIQKYTIDVNFPLELRDAKRLCSERIETNRHVANPIAKDGMSMAPKGINDTPDSLQSCGHCTKIHTSECPYFDKMVNRLSSDLICEKFQWDDIPF